MQLGEVTRKIKGNPEIEMQGKESVCNRECTWSERVSEER